MPAGRQGRDVAGGDWAGVGLELAEEGVVGAEDAARGVGAMVAVG